MESYETPRAKKDKKLILKSYPKQIQNKLIYFFSEIIDNPRDKNAVGEPEQLRHTEKELWSR